MSGGEQGAGAAASPGGAPPASNIPGWYLEDRQQRRSGPARLAGEAVFENPQNGYRESVPQEAWLWMLLLGVVYMAVRGLWTHVAVVAGLMLLTMVVPVLGVLIAIPTWIGYAMNARKLITESYLRRGWRPVDTSADTAASVLPDRDLLAQAPSSAPHDAA